MERLEVSGAVRQVKVSLGVKGLRVSKASYSVLRRSPLNTKTRRLFGK